MEKYRILAYLWESYWHGTFELNLNDQIWLGHVTCRMSEIEIHFFEQAWADDF